MPDPALGEPERVQGRLGPLDPAQDPDRHLVPYGTRLARQAAAGLSHVRRPSSCERGAHVGLREAGVDEREHRPPSTGGALPGAMVAEIVDVDAEHDGGALGRRDRADHVHQLGLAVEAAVAVVEPVGGALHLVRDHRRPAQAPLGGQRLAVVALGAGQRRRDRGDGVRAFGTQYARARPPPGTPSRRRR